MAILKINGADIPAPKTCKIGISDQDYNSDTDSNGTLHRNRVAIKRKISNEWGPLTWTEISKILTSVKGVFFNVTYPDPETEKYETKRMYVSDRTSPIAIEQEDGSIMWEGLTADFVEK